MKVTFDTNVFQPVVRPDLFPGDPDSNALHRIRGALTQRNVFGFIADPIANIEQIPKAKRAAYFSGIRAVVAGSHTLMPDGTLKVSVIIKPDPSAHPGLPGILVDRIKDGVALGVQILHCPRTALPIAPELQPAWFVSGETQTEQTSRQNTFFAVLSAIEQRGVGRAVLENIGNELLVRHNTSGPWYVGLGLASTATEMGRLKKAVAEWSDGDAIAAHVAYGNDIFCTRDAAVAAGNSIFDAGNRQWLEMNYGVAFCMPAELALRL